MFPWLSKYCTWPAKNFSVGRPNEQQWEKKRKIQKRCCIYFVLEPLKEFLFSDPNTKIYWSKTKRLQIASELRKMSLLSINVYGAGKSKNEQKEKCRAKKSFVGLCDIWPNNLVSQKKIIYICSWSDRRCAVRNFDVGLILIDFQLIKIEDVNKFLPQTKKSKTKKFRFPSSFSAKRNNV